VPSPAQPPLAPDLEQKRSIKHQIHQELVDRMDIKRLAASRIRKEELRSRAMETIRKIVEEVAPRLPQGIRPDALIKEICDEALGLGPLEEYLSQDDVTEIMVNGPNQIYVEKAGKLTLTGGSFMDDSSVLAIIERIVSPLGRRIDESQPYVDARLPDGSRVNAVIHPLSLVGPCLTIRKFSKNPFNDKDLIRFGTWTEKVADFCNICVKMRKNIVVSGGTGSGKTSLLNVLGNYLPPTERIVTIEDAAELRLTQPHVVRLEARPPNIEGRGAVTIRDLVRNSLRMRPDRIVVGECRGGEALDMLQAMNTGHDGSLTTVHANSPRDVISRLETMVLMSGMELPVRAIREQISSAIDVIVHESRFSDGSRKITSVTEICGQEGEQITMQEIFTFEQTGLDADGKVLGTHKATGSVPTFIEEINARGLSIDRTMFNPQQWKG
jgi:pilus assembly protein CpaF